jgi:hypothetical protein|tara:strand:- start:1231 stop:1452 length:222 start_codon:yes stop_codon:yes gene_type:complete
MKRDLLPVKDHKGWYKDSKTGIVLNINNDDIVEHNQRIRDARARERLEVDQLKDEVQQLKMLLHKLLENGSNG